MKKIGIVGSGRWAKVTLRILINIFNGKIKFIFFSNHGIEQLKNWISQENFKIDYLEVADYDQVSKKICDAYIILNAAKDHFKISKKIISSGKPIIIEKPLALSKSDVKILVDLSIKEKTIFGASNIFLFANYILNFKKLISASQNISSIEFIWSDPKNESRYGDLKHFDPSLGIHKDVLPHIFSIVFYLFETNKATIKNICFLNGGSYIKISMIIEGKNCNIKIKRNNKKRERIIKILDKDIIKMDFANEPGTVKINNKKEILDTQWDISESPATKMYRSFFDTLNEKNSTLDPRIKPSNEIYALIDDVDALYIKEQDKYIRKSITDKIDELDDFNYCIKEYFLVKSLAKYDDVDTKVFNFIKLLKNKSINTENLLNKDLSAFVRMHI